MPTRVSLSTTGNPVHPFCLNILATASMGVSTDIVTTGKDMRSLIWTEDCRFPAISSWIHVSTASGLTDFKTAEPAWGWPPPPMLRMIAPTSIPSAELRPITMHRSRSESEKIPKVTSTLTISIYIRTTTARLSTCPLTSILLILTVCPLILVRPAVSSILNRISFCFSPYAGLKKVLMMFKSASCSSK